MTFVITQNCCNDSSCIPVCPVQCIRPRPGDPDFNATEQLYIDPETCIDCGACLTECPVDAIYQDWELPEQFSDYLEMNAAYFETRPIEPSLPEIHKRRELPNDVDSIAVAIVGSGPAACYAADSLSAINGVSVSIFERLPTPFGLIRSGVAPDHPHTKQVANRFSSILGRANVRCFFNVEVGADISIDELLEYHHAVIWAGGAPAGRALGIPGESLAGCLSARDLISWCNGHPDYAELDVDLRGPRAIIIGNGNVALDAARLLVQPAAAFAATDISDAALNALGERGCEEVVVTARRGPEFAAYTTGELLALHRNEDITLLAVGEDLAGTAVGDDRRSQILAEIERRAREPHERAIVFRYGLRPVSINGGNRVASVTFERWDGTQETIETDLVLRAIGSRGAEIPGLPFDATTGVLPNRHGRVWDPESELSVPGVYCAGWIKRGATGVIGSNRTDSAETVDALLQDLEAGQLRAPLRGVEQLAGLLGERVPQLVDKDAWRRIDRTERTRGRADGRPLRKLVTYAELLSEAGVGTGS